VSETELLLRIAKLAGEYCGFEPALPVKTANLSNSCTDLADLISKATVSCSQTVICPDDAAPLPTFGIFKKFKITLLLLLMIMYFYSCEFQLLS
jgi:hypothetical protein